MHDRDHSADGAGDVDHVPIGGSHPPDEGIIDRIRSVLPMVGTSETYPPDRTDHDGDPILPVDEAGGVISNRRRVLLLAFMEVWPGDVIDLSNAAEAIAAYEDDIDPVDLTASKRKTVYVVLYQHHLPHLTEAGLVEWVDRKRTFVPGPHYDPLVSWLEDTALTFGDPVVAEMDRLVDEWIEDDHLA